MGVGRFVWLAIWLAASPSRAAEWVHVTRSQDRTSLAIDVSSIVQKGSVRTAWIQFSSLTPEKDGAVLRRQLWGYDCSQRLKSILSYVSYDARGKPITSHTPPEYLRDIEPIVPDTIGEAAYNFICSYPIGTDWREIEGLQPEG